MAIDIYKITSINDDGKAVEVYSLPQHRSLARKMMLSEYGNVEDDGISIDEAPNYVQEAYAQLLLEE